MSEQHGKTQALASARPHPNIADKQGTHSPGPCLRAGESIHPSTNLAVGEVRDSALPTAWRWGMQAAVTRPANLVQGLEVGHAGSSQMTGQVL